MLSMNNKNDILNMLKYYRTSDMINLITYFPEISPIRDLTIIESEDDFIKNIDYVTKLKCNCVDSLKGKKVLEIQNSGHSNDFFKTLRRIKEIDPEGVLVLFNSTSINSDRDERYAGISVGVEVGTCVYIDAVGKGFDGREVSKGVCYHERYVIPWFELRKVSLENFKGYRTFLINDDDYLLTRKERIEFLKSIGYDKKNFDISIPVKYQEIPDFIWKYLIDNLLKKLEKKEEELLLAGFKSFVISGHTEGKVYTPWKMYDKGRYMELRK